MHANIYFIHFFHEMTSQASGSRDAVQARKTTTSRSHMHANILPLRDSCTASTLPAIGCVLFFMSFSFYFIFILPLCDSCTADRTRLPGENYGRDHKLN